MASGEQKELLKSFPQSIREACERDPKKYNARQLLLFAECMRDDPEGSLSPCRNIMTKWSIRYHCGELGGISPGVIQEVIESFPCPDF